MTAGPGVPFRDRADAGRRLAALVSERVHGDVVVVALPRGGVPVAAEVGRALRAPLDVLVVRKLGYPRQPELGMGAIGEGGVRVVNRDLVDRLGVDDATVDAVAGQETAELERRVRRYRGDRPRHPVAGRTVVLVDDGVATGSTALAAIEVLRSAGARAVVVAVPVAPPDAVAAMRAAADDVVVVETPSQFWAIGEWYDDFRQVGDEEVARHLAEAAPEPVEED